MPRFEPFTGIRYDSERVRLDDVVAPPYDVIDADAQAALEARSPHNIVRVDLPRPDPAGDPYAAAAGLFDGWLEEGVLRPDPQPGFYAYSMGYHDVAGRPRQIAGVLGALEVVTPGHGGVLPHEETQHKIRDDRLRLLRACRADLSPVWGLSMAEGLSALCAGVAGPPVARTTDEEGVHHRMWPVTQPGVIEAMMATVTSAPVVLADGHHRYETALAYRDERRATRRGADGDDDLLMALVAELADGQAGVRPIHRVIAGLPEGFDIVAGLEPSFGVLAFDGPVDELPERMAEAGALGLVLASGERRLLVPEGPDDGGDDDTPSDAALLDRALADLPPHTLGFEHSLASVAAQVSSGHVQAGVLLRPVNVTQIAATARAGRRMPTKTTFFHPKPRTGMLFRRRSD